MSRTIKDYKRKQWQWWLKESVKELICMCLSARLPAVHSYVRKYGQQLWEAFFRCVLLRYDRQRTTDNDTTTIEHKHANVERIPRSAHCFIHWRIMCISQFDRKDCCKPLCNIYWKLNINQHAHILDIGRHCLPMDWELHLIQILLLHTVTTTPTTTTYGVTTKISLPVRFSLAVSQSFRMPQDCHFILYLIMNCLLHTYLCFSAYAPPN